MKRVVLVLLAVALAIVVVWQVVVRVRESRAPKPKRGGGAVPVETAQVTQRTLREVQTLTGSLSADSRFVIAPKVAGRLVRLHVHIGDTVQPGQLLAELDDAEYAQELAQARAELAVAQATAEEVRLTLSLEQAIWREEAAQAEADLAMSRAAVEEAQTSLEAARRELERLQALREKQIAAAAELDSAQDRFSAEQSRVKVQQADLARRAAALKAAQLRLSPAQAEAHAAKLAHATAQVAQQEAAVKAAELRVSYTRLTADWPAESGPRVIGDRYVDEGALLQPNTPVVSVLDIRQLTAITYVTEREYAKVRPGLAAELTTDAVPGVTFTAQVVRVAPQLAEASRQARVEFAVANAELHLKPGLFVRLRTQFDQHERVTAVPFAALVRRQERQGVFAIDPAARTVAFVPVTLGLQDGDWVEIREPALTGLVATLGNHLLTDGSNVALPGEGGGQGKPQPPAAAATATTPGKGRP
jgi:RND family efflux transporter MFP subunit